MKVKELLAAKESPEVAMISGDENVLQAAKEMNARGIGSLVVTEEGETVGIFSERDILRRVVAELRNPEETKVKEVMTSPPIIIHPDDTVDHCQGIMTQRRIRHLPVIDEGKVVGMITSGDIMAQSHRDGQVEIEYLTNYITGSRATVPKL